MGKIERTTLREKKMIVEFYEKPGCINNTRQKELLESYGHIVNAHSLLSVPWTADKLRFFFGEMPVKDWFNNASPRIKSGEINPSNFNEEKALLAMLNDPLLIRRPLLEVEGQFICGFDNEVITELLINADVSQLQTCPKIKTNNNCN